VVLKLAAQHDIPLELVQGTGVEGRVTRQDVMRYLEKPVAHTVPPSSSSGVVGVSERQTPPPARPAPAKSTARSVEAPAPDGTSAAETTRAASPAGASASTGDDELRTLSATRKTIAKRLLDAHLTMPPAWMVVEADVTELVALREASKDAFRRTEGVGLTYLPFFVQAAVSALKQHPVINATFADDGITVHHRYHVGIAVAVESGLIVPVVRDADRKSIAGLAREIEELGRKARDRKLGIEDVRGATFTLDNTGAFGSVISQPLIPPGQAAILTTEAIRREVRVTEDGSFAARSVMNLCISFDHRALDGAQAGLFMRAVKQRIEAIRAEQEIY
jgi:2-oxoisovalerate dehydrogenase E2 component (dihydrolipoyl transacylase)